MSDSAYAYSEALISLFPDEFYKLNDEEAAALIEDCRAADEEDNRIPAEYARCIGRGNLLAYVDCLIAGKLREGKGNY